jgi:hypothetical protein
VVTFYCPACWQEISEEDKRCPVCGFDLSKDKALSFEEKLLRTLEHPVQENRLLAIQILGNLGAPPDNRLDQKFSGWLVVRAGQRQRHVQATARQHGVLKYSCSFAAEDTQLAQPARPDHHLT